MALKTDQVVIDTRDGNISIRTSDTGELTFEDSVLGERTLSQLGGAGTGDVTGPASATNSAVCRYDGTTGKSIKNSTVTVSDTGAVNAPGGYTGLDIDVTGDISSGQSISATGSFSTGTGNFITGAGNISTLGGTISGNDASISTSLTVGTDLDVAGDIRTNGFIPVGNKWSIQSSAADEDWQSVTYGAGIFVAVASTGAGDRVMTSQDGKNWTSQTNATDNNWKDVTYGQGKFIAVADSGIGDRIMWSADGKEWTTANLSPDLNYKSVAYGSNVFVAVGYNGGVALSIDGENWISQTAASTNDWEAVTYGNGLFVAVSSSGTGNRVMTSSDGVTWVSRSSAADNTWVDVAYGNGTFIAVSTDGGTTQIMDSATGISWTTSTSPVSNQWQAVTYANGQWVAVSSTGTNDRFMVATDPTSTWETISTLGIDRDMQSVVYGNGMLVAVANSGTGSRVITSSRTIKTETFERDFSSDFIQATKEHTGFEDPSLAAANMSYNSVNRTVTISQGAKAYWRGRIVPELVDGWTSEPHTASPTSSQFLYYRNGSFVWSSTSWIFSDIMIAYVFVNELGAVYWCLPETHGTMPWQSHEAIHESIGSRRGTGGDVSGIVLGSTTATDRRPQTSELIINDEDVPHTLAAHTSQNNYTWGYFSGTTMVPTMVTGNAEITPLTGNIPRWNENTGSTWQLTDYSNNSYGVLFEVGIPTDTNTTDYRYTFVPAQINTVSLSEAEAYTWGDMDLTSIQNLIPEVLPIHKYVLQYVGGGTANWNIVSSVKISGTKQNLIQGGGGITSVVTDDVTIDGNGTISDPVEITEPGFVTTVPSITNSLTATDKRFQVATGTAANYTLQLPDATTLRARDFFEITNASSQSIKVQNSSQSLLYVMPAGAYAKFQLVDNSTAAGVWNSPTTNTTELVLPGTITTGDDGTTSLTFVDNRHQLITGSGINHVVTLPDATTLRGSGDFFEFTNASSEFVGVENSDQTAWVRVPPGTVATFRLVSGATAAGVWSQSRCMSDADYGSYIIDDFHTKNPGVVGGPFGWQDTLSGAGAIVGNVSDISKGTGAIYLGTGTTSAGYAVYNCGTRETLGLHCQARDFFIKVNTLSTASEEFEINLGTNTDFGVHAITEGFGFRYARLTAGSNVWSIFSKDSTAESRTDTAVSVAVQDYYLRCEVSSDGLRVDYWIDRSHVGSKTVNIPASIGFNQLSVGKVAGTGSRLFIADAFALTTAWQNGRY